MRRALAVLSSIGLGIGTIALAAPASAQLPTIALDNSNNLSINGQTVTNFTFAGTQFTFANNSGGTLRLRSATSGYLTNTDTGSDCETATNCQVADGDEIDLTIEQQSSSDRVDVLKENQFSQGSYTSVTDFRVEYSSGGGGGGGGQSGSSDSGGSAPASEIQQFGLPASGNCEDGATEAMNWSGVGLDGWSISWAQWANDGAGGPVCTRTVMYDTSTAKWVVN